MKKMKSNGGVIAIAIAALMSSVAFVNAADLIVPESQPAASPLLDNVPIAHSKGPLSFEVSLGLGYIDFGDTSSKSVEDPDAAWLNVREESVDVSVPTLNVGFTAIRELEHRPYNVFIDVGAFVGLADGEARTDMRQEENLNFVPDPDVLLVATGTEKEPSSVTEDVSVWGLTAAVGPQFNLGGANVKIGPSIRYASFSGGNLDDQIFAGVTGAVALTEVNGLNIGANASYERDISGGDLDDVWAAGLGISKKF